jgi:prepilin-type N-terminal cleavage/methylation domain-containing protein
MSRPNVRRGFTLIELLVVIAIMAVLIGLLLPAVQKVREAAARVKCQNNLKQLALGVHNYHDSAGRFPPSRTPGNGPTWAVFLLPYVEQSPLYDQWRKDLCYHSQPAGLTASPVPGYACPSRRSAPMVSLDGDGRGAIPHIPGATSDYAGVFGSVLEPDVLYVGSLNRTAPSKANGVFVGGVGTAGGTDPYFTHIRWQAQVTFTGITDGTSQTMMFGEKHVQRGSLARKNPTEDASVYNSLPVP